MMGRYRAHAFPLHEDLPTMPSTGAAELLRSVGLMADGPVLWGAPIRAAGPGVYLVELPNPPVTAPIELTRVGKWLERVAELRLDGRRPSSRALSARLAAFWLPGQPVLYVGATAGSIAGRVAGLERHVLGDRRPHAGGQWLKTLDVERRFRIWWAATNAPEEYEDALLSAFREGVAADGVPELPDTDVILPFANLATPTGDRKRHGITGAVPPEPASTTEPERHVVAIEPGDADGARQPDRGTGTVRRSNARQPARRRTGVERTQRQGATPRRAVAPTQLSAEGLERLRSELEHLTRVRRPEVVGRIRAAKELGDLKENADYAAAREEQSFLEGRIQALEALLRDAVVVEAPTGATVAVGSRVVIEQDGERSTYSIVSSAEADPAAGRISFASPVGRALIGHPAGADVTVRTPNGEVRYRIVEIG
jgi:transcription elongation factor GreA